MSSLRFGAALFNEIVWVFEDPLILAMSLFVSVLGVEHSPNASVNARLSLCPQ
jgi:hypothetical protein